LTATALNNVAVAFVIAGFVGPMVAVGYGSAAMAAVGYGSAAMARDGIAILVSIIWLFIGFILHSIARLILRDLKP
jgi:hypothetical protein